MASKHGWHVLFRFAGEHTWQELNDLIRFETGNVEPFFTDEDAYNTEVKYGFVKYDGRETIVLADGECEE